MTVIKNLPTRFKFWSYKFRGKKKSKNRLYSKDIHLLMSQIHSMFGAKEVPSF
jgi:hypothetical protein